MLRSFMKALIVGLFGETWGNRPSRETITIFDLGGTAAMRTVMVDPRDLPEADSIILPGVGSYRDSLRP